MELLLNLIWLTLALGAFWPSCAASAPLPGWRKIPYRRSLIALACVALLLFPVVSASDDLHPAQAVVEEASKRVQLAVAPLHLLRTSSSAAHVAGDAGALPAVRTGYFAAVASLGFDGAGT